MSPDFAVDFCLKQKKETDAERAKSNALLERNRELHIEKQQVQQQVRESVKEAGIREARVQQAVAQLEAKNKQTEDHAKMNISQTEAQANLQVNVAVSKVQHLASAVQQAQS